MAFRVWTALRSSPFAREPIVIQGHSASFFSAEEFFVTNNGERKQNFDLIDEGVISEDSFDVFAKNTAEFVRNLPDFIKGKVNKFAFDLCSNDKTT